MEVHDAMWNPLFEGVLLPPAHGRLRYGGNTAMADCLGNRERQTIDRDFRNDASRRTPSILWVHNDGSDERIFALSTNGRVIAVFKLQTKVTDLEDTPLGRPPRVNPTSIWVTSATTTKREARSVSIGFPNPRSARARVPRNPSRSRASTQSPCATPTGHTMRRLCWWIRQPGICSS